MVDVVGRAKVIIEGDVDRRSIDAAGGKIGSALKTGATVGVAALGTLTVAGFKAFQAFEDGEAQTRKLQTVLGNMGKSGATEALDGLASTLQRTTGVSDDVIKGGETILATFSEVAASAGEVGGNFERATRASVDLAAAGFGTVESASVMLGKALQDPVNGVTALSRAGVTFSEDQKKMIAALVETGEVGKAQNIILAEVEKQVKGTGEASATESGKVKEAFGEIQEAAGGALAALGGGKKGKSLSKTLFDVSDAITELAESKGWADFGKELRDTAHYADEVSDALIKVRREGQKVADKIPGLGPVFEALVDPFRGTISVLGDLIDKWHELQRLTGMGGRSSQFVPGRDLTLEDFTGPGLATGGTSMGGWTITGEQGPELVNLPAGAQVHSTANSKRILADAAGASFALTQVFNGPNSLAEARKDADFYTKYGTRFGAATWAGAR